MKDNPNNWAEKLYDWAESRVRIAVEKKSQIFQIAAALVVFIVSAGSLQYVPFLVSWFHINDMLFGKIVVYSLPVWIAFAIFLIWRS
jgi:hypothetical protein